MDTVKYGKYVEERLKADQAMKAVGKELQEYDDQRQDLRIERAEIFQPVTAHVKEVKETIDSKQDKLLEKITENQNALATAIVNFAPTPTHASATPLPPLEGFTSPKFTETITPPHYKADIDKNFTLEELKRLMEYQLPPPSDVMEAVMKNDLNWREFDKTLGKLNQDLGRKKGQLSKSKKAKDENASAIDNLTNDIKLIQKYRTRIKLLDEGQPLLSPSFTGSGVRNYKQPKRNAYNMDTFTGHYGGLVINVPRLKKEMIFEVQKGGKIIYEQPADKSLIDLLTKKYKGSPQKYSSKAIQIFQDVNNLANMPKHRSSGKSKLLKPQTFRGGQIYYTSPEDLMKRLTLLTGTRLAGNTNISHRNEIWEILDHLLKNEQISKKDYDIYIQKFLQ